MSCVSAAALDVTVGLARVVCCFLLSSPLPIAVDRAMMALLEIQLIIPRSIRVPKTPQGRSLVRKQTKRCSLLSLLRFRRRKQRTRCDARWQEVGRVEGDRLTLGVEVNVLLPLLICIIKPPLIVTYKS